MTLELLIGFRNAALLQKWPESSNQTKALQIVAVLDRGIGEIIYIPELPLQALLEK